ncbi:MAG: glucose-6-phosphate dehydrogenase, partial [Ghiorsea sp.]|nr:glucose-6-phosphate dehydrogenase [Ghiorsea sp.]
MTQSSLDSSSPFPTLADHGSSPDPCVFVIFGASGDLTKRLLIPSLFNLYSDGLLPEKFVILGLSLDDFSTDSFRQKISKDVHKHSRRTYFNETVWDKFCENIHYLQGSFE